MSKAHEQELVLAAQFPTPQREQWQELIAGVLRKSGRVPADFDGDAAEKIATKTYDDILVQPLYTRTDVADVYKRQNGTSSPILRRRGKRFWPTLSTA